MEGLHAVVLVLHSILRWVVLVLGVLAFVRCVRGLRGDRVYAESDGKLVRGFVAAFHTELLLGFALWLGVSPLGVRMFDNAAVAMKQASLRFFMVEHVFGMVLAAVVLTVGAARARRAVEEAAKYRKASVAIAIAFVIMAASIPWPFLPYGRPLFRGL